MQMTSNNHYHKTRRSYFVVAILLEVMLQYSQQSTQVLKLSFPRYVDIGMRFLAQRDGGEHPGAGARTSLYTTATNATKGWRRDTTAPSARTFTSAWLAARTTATPTRWRSSGLTLDGGKGEAVPTSNPQEARKLSIQRCIQSLVHACQCRDANCRLPSCHKMKRVVSHTKQCKRKTNGGCPICKQLIALCCYHAKLCQVRNAVSWGHFLVL